jgi:hypothetical protein
MDGELWVNVRFVNYRIGDGGEYLNQSIIESINVVAVFTWETSADVENLVKKREFLLDYDKTVDGLYVGLEDVRFFAIKNRVLYHANRIVGERIFVEHGSIDTEKGCTRDSVFLQIENQRKTEKNWVLFEDPDNSIKIVYDWYPLIIGTKGLLENHIYDIIKNPSPPFFRHVRGSTHGVRIDSNEIWFLCHIVSYESRRYYYHIMVVLDAGSLKVKKYTHPFTLERAPVEYALGLIYDEKSTVFFVSYSVMDRTSQIGVIPKRAFDEMMYSS